MTTRKSNNSTNLTTDRTRSNQGSNHGTSDMVLDLNSEVNSREYDRNYTDIKHEHHGGNNNHGNHKKHSKKKKKKSKAPIIIIIAVVVVLAGIYVGIALYGQSHFLPNTFVRGQEVSWMTPEEAEDRLITSESSFEIKKIDGEEYIDFADIDYRIYLTVPAEELIASQSVWTWPARLFSPSVYSSETQISYDKAALRREINDLDMFKPENITKCKNAYLLRDSEGHYSIVPEVNGNELVKSKTVREINSAVASGLFEIDLVEKDLYKKPSVLSTDERLNKTLSDYQTIGEEEITIDLDGGKTITLKPADILNFVTIDGGNFWVNEDYLAAYIDELDEEYSTYMKPRNFKTHSGTVLKVGGSILGGYDGDTYGYLMDKETSTDILRDAILSCQTQTVPLAWEMMGNVRDDFNRDIGHTYIEISISEQHMWYYVNGQIALETDVVTGLGSYDKRQTPEGVFSAVYMDKNVTLTGAMDGSQWKTTVDYWISVTYTGVGIHDANWQPTFGGDWYMWNGSHGCINTPPDNMAALYSMVELYTPIIIYSFSNENVTEEGSHATRNNYQNEEYVEETTTPAVTTTEAATTTPAATEPSTEDTTEAPVDTTEAPEPTEDPAEDPTTPEED